MMPPYALHLCTISPHSHLNIVKLRDRSWLEYTILLVYRIGMLARLFLKIDYRLQKNRFFSIIVFIEQCYDHHYFEVRTQWT